jgi:hypothetical protein
MKPPSLIWQVAAINRITAQTKTWPLNRGDLMLLVVLIDQEIQANPPIANAIRLVAMREKLGDLVADAPEMSKEEAQKFR